MKSCRWFLALILLGVSSSSAMADGVDPTMGLEGGGGSTALFSPNDPAFSFTVFGGTANFPTVGSSLFFDFINATGQVATAVNLTLTLVPGTTPLTFTCIVPTMYFNTCSPLTPTTLSGGGSLLVSFFNFGEGSLGGIPFATQLTCNSEISNDCTTTTPGADFKVVVTDVAGDLRNLSSSQGFNVQGSLAVPEPSTVLLVIAGGILLLFVKRKPAASRSPFCQLA